MLWVFFYLSSFPFSVFFELAGFKATPSPRFCWSTRVFVHCLAVATAEALPVPKIRDTQQEYGQLLPAEQCWIPPSDSRHHVTPTTPTIFSSPLRIPTGLCAFSPTLPVHQSQPFTVIALAFFKPLSVCDLKDPGSGSANPAGQDPLFPGACLP